MRLILGLTILLFPALTCVAQDNTTLIKVDPKEMQAPTERQPALRAFVNPYIPYDAETSGYCCMYTDVNEVGRVTELRTLYCTDPIFERPTRNALSKGIYAPAVRNGKKIASTSVQKALFFLSEENGNFIPDPDGYLGYLDPERPNTTQRLCFNRLMG